MFSLHNGQLFYNALRVINPLNTIIFPKKSKKKEYRDDTD